MANGLLSSLSGNALVLDGIEDVQAQLTSLDKEVKTLIRQNRILVTQNEWNAALAEPVPNAIRRTWWSQCTQRVWKSDGPDSPAPAATSREPYGYLLGPVPDTITNAA